MQVLACALLYDLGAADDGIRCGELAAFCVAPGFRGSGRGDSLLDYVEQVCHLPSGVSILLQLHLPAPGLCTPSPVLGRSVVLAALSRSGHEAGWGMQNSLSPASSNLLLSAVTHGCGIILWFSMPSPERAPDAIQCIMRILSAGCTKSRHPAPHAPHHTHSRLV